MNQDRVIAITTDEQAKVVMQMLEREHRISQANNYAAERKKPIRRMLCCCCGRYFHGRQWFNQDTGYGLGDCCVSFCKVDPTPDVEDETYGVPGIHFLIEETTTETSE